MPSRPTIDHDEMTERRLASILALTREESYRRAGHGVSPAQSQVWAIVKDPDVHTVITYNVRLLMNGSDCA